MLIGGLGISACASDDASGDSSVTVLLEAEDVIVEGLSPGSEVESIRDGWTVSFEKYLITVGGVDLHLVTDESVKAEAPDQFVVDLTTVEDTGLALWSVEGIREGRWDFNYSTEDADAMRHESVSDSDFEAMNDAGWTHFVVGTLTKEDGVSCPPEAFADVPDGRTSTGENAGGDRCYDNPEIRFAFGADAATTYGPCEIDGVPGLSTTAGETTTIAITIHGDHLFFNGFPEGTEGGVLRLAQWLADSDLNLDGEVTREELEVIAPGDLPVIDARYQLGGSPITPLDSMATYVTAQLKTQGHFQGEGECPVDGAGHP